jgi:penicillin-binding protein 2
VLAAEQGKDFLLKFPSGIRPFRAFTLIALPILLACVLLLALYSLQVVNRAAYREQGRSTITRVETVPAARGDILDRYGRLLVTNAVSYDIHIERSVLVTDEDPNGILLGLIELTEAGGIRHTDTLPITADAPFAFTEMDDIQAGRMADWLEHFELQELSAPEVMDWMRNHYAVPEDYTPAQARLAVGVRWELELRTLFGIVDYVFAAGLDQEMIAAVSERCYPGVSITVGSHRVYRTPYAAHLLGRIGPINKDQVEKFTELGYPMNALVGQDGAEAAFEEYLHGVDGKRVTIRSAEGEILSSYYTEEPRAGADVTLTLDLSAQQVTEEALAAEIAKINADRVKKAKPGETVQLAQGGAAVVIQVGTGDVLAAASYPSYDLSEFLENYSQLVADPARPMFNRALQGRYAPGSTFKVVTATAALTEGIITPNTTIYDRGIIDEYEGITFTCWTYPGSHGTINVMEALQMSCNYFFYITGRSLGIAALDRYAAAYGLGQSTGIELYENTGVLASVEYKKEAIGEDWYVGDTLQAAIGQSYHLFTPLQLASYAATIASDGKRYANHMLYSVSGPQGFRNPPELLSSVNASEDTYAVLREGMLMASRYGSASYVFGNYRIPVCSKTGTAQVSEDTVNNAVFIAFAPMEDPEIALAVVVENGANGYYLAEVARDIFDWYFTREPEAAPIPENTLLP